ncbi:hypothetical protein CEB3_c28050 [Peptococcaceae bacterium CEB3]|nr:hypothetical protein CEB3_c28050 [Peptococcaceae bacterium CEB3]
MIMAHVSLADCFTLLLLAASFVLTEMFLSGELRRPRKNEDRKSASR